MEHGRCRWKLEVISIFLVGAVILGACGEERGGGSVASAGRQEQEGVSEDQDNPTPSPPVPVREEGCDSEASVDAARATATSSAMATINRLAATPLSEISANAPTVLSGTVVGVEQGGVRPINSSDFLPGTNEAEPQVQLMANILLKVEHAEGPEASMVSAQEVVAVPFTVLAQAPADDAYVEHRAATHTNMVNGLRCAMPNSTAAVFITDLDSEATSDGPRLAELPTVLWVTNPAAVVLQDQERGIASLDASVPISDSSYFDGAATVEQLVADIG